MAYLDPIPQVHARATVGDARFDLDLMFHRWANLVKRAETIDLIGRDATKAWTEADAYYQVYVERLADAEKTAAELKRQGDPQ